MSSLAPIISFVVLNKDYWEANFSKYKKDQGTSIRQGEPLEFESDKQVKTESLIVNTVLADPQGSTKEEDRRRKGKAVTGTRDLLPQKVLISKGESLFKSSFALLNKL